MLRIVTVPVTLFEQNCRILIDTETGQSVVIDPGGDCEKIVSCIKEEQCSVEEIWLTHSHLDHCAAVAPLRAQLPVPVIGSELEKEMRSSVCTIAAMYGLPAEEWPNCPEPTRYISGGDEVFVGTHCARVLATPGHSPGHVSFYFEADGVVLGGDALFSGSIGRTDLPGGNTEQLLGSIREQLFALPDETRVLSGHGPDTTIHIEKTTNPFFA